MCNEIDSECVVQLKLLFKAYAGVLACMVHVLLYFTKRLLYSYLFHRKDIVVN